jgi:MFS family permease
MKEKNKRFLGKYGFRGTPIFVFSLVVLFWTVFDSIMSYITPLLIEEQGFSKTMIGFIIGTSSITGAFFDFIVCKVFKNTNFRRIFLIMFAICFIYPFLLWQAKSLWFFLFVMSVWGVYFDFYGFGVFDFIGRYTKKEDHTPSFGMVQMFRALGGMIAPLVVGLVVIDNIDWRAFSLGWIFLAIGLIFFITLMVLMRKSQPVNVERACPLRRKNLFIELHLWRKLGRLMMPVLFLTFFLYFIEAFFWTLAPLYAETSNLGQFGGLFLTAYTFPALLVGWFVGSLTKSFGKKRTAFVSLLVGSSILSSFFFLPSPIVSIGVIFIASLFISMALPAINAAYADYISEAPRVEGEIEGLEDFAFNVGYVVGPLSAGILADNLGTEAAFSAVGLLGVALALVLLSVTPKSIVIKTKASEL